MRFGICTTVENSAAAKAAGWDFVEERVDLLLQGLLSDAEWQGAARAKTSVLPIPAANVLVPGTLKITGPDADLNKLSAYIRNVMSRASKLGMKTIVFGSGGARNVPDGFDRSKARSQIIDFLKMIAPIAQQNGITLVIEHLNRKECNIINSLDEAMTYVRELNHPNIQCLVDSYHFWMENEPVSSIGSAGPAIKHVHVADKDGRVAPSLSGTANYRSFFAELKRVGYSGPISVEALKFDIAKDGRRVLEFLKEQWNNA